MLRQGFVVEVHPDDHSVDLVMMDDGSRLVGVQVQTPNGSRRTGTVDLPEIPKRKNKWDISKKTDDDMIATVDYIGRTPIVTGFLYPQVNRMLLKDGRTRIMRHQSDVIETIDGRGNYQWVHPSGLHIRMGETPDLEPIQNADGGAAADRNTDVKPYIRVGLPGGKMTITVNPDGQIQIDTQDEVILNAQKAVTVHSDESITLDTPTVNVTHDLNVGGALNVAGATALHDITSNGKDISDKHRHLNSGGPSTGGPVA